MIDERQTCGNRILDEKSGGFFFLAYTLEFKNRERDMCTEHSMATEQIMNKNHVREKTQKFDEGIVAYNQMMMIHLYKGSFAHFGCVF